MALTPVTYQFISQQGLNRLIDASTGPSGPTGVSSFWLVPANGYINTQRIPHDINEDLAGAGFEKTTVEGLDYFLVPEESSNLPGLLSHYAQKTGVAELQNPSGGGVNRVRETLLNTAEATVAPDAVKKYLDDNDAYEEARKKQSEENAAVDRQVTVSPAREGGEGKLVESKSDSSSSDVPKQASKPASKQASS